MRRSEFFHRIPELFRTANVREWDAYEETLFHMRRPVTHGNYWRIRRYCGANPPQPALADARVHASLDGILSRAKYPDARPLGRLDEFSDKDSRVASALLHFNNPAYPLYDESSVTGLRHLGVPVEYVARLEPGAVDQYQTFIDAIQDLKEDVPYYDVPEKNYYLTRIIQESLGQLGTEPAPRTPRKAPSRRRTRPATA